MRKLSQKQLLSKSFSVTYSKNTSKPLQKLLLNVYGFLLGDFKLQMVKIKQDPKCFQLRKALAHSKTWTQGATRCCFHSSRTTLPSQTGKDWSAADAYNIFK